MLRAVDGVHTWTSPDGLTLVLNELDDLTTGEPKWPRYRLLDVDHGYPEAGDTLHKRVGQSGAVSHPDYRGPRIHSYTIEVMGRTITELRQGEETLRAAFYDQSAEGRMDVGTHPLNPDYDADDDRYFNAKALSLQTGTNAPDSDLSPQLGFRREWVVGLRNHAGVYYEPMTLETFKQAVLDLGPSLYWALDSGDGANDLSPNNRNGTGGGSVTIGAAAGILEGIPGDSATDFDGTDDRVAATYAPFVTDSKRSFLAFVNLDDNSDEMIVSSDAGSNQADAIYVTSALSIFPDHAQGGQSGGAVTTATDHCLVTTYDDATGAYGLYIDGELAEAGTLAASSDYSAAPGNLRVGARATSSNAANGRIAHVAVFERILTADEIASIYELASTGIRSRV